MLERSIKTIAGSVIIIIGIILTPLPIPFGILFILVGMSILVTVIPGMRSRLVAMRLKYSKTSQKLNSIKHHLPGFLQRLVDETDPDKAV